MTYVLTKNPTDEEKKIVNKQYRLQDELYKKYNTFLYDGTKERIGMSLMIKLWDRYLKELKEYNRLYNQYMGYCY
jgi:ABC-type dipeptide/oligopeptide/nickel transport system permease component